MAAALDHDPFSTRILFEPLLDEPVRSYPPQDSYAAIDKDTLSLNDRLDLAFKSDHGFDLPDTPSLQLPELCGIEKLSDYRPPILPAHGTQTEALWQLSHADTALDQLASLRTWKLNVPTPASKSGTSNADQPASGHLRTIPSALEQTLCTLRQCAARVTRENPSSPTRIALASCLSNLETELGWLLLRPSGSELNLDAESITPLLADVVKTVQACENKQDTQIIAHLSLASRSTRYASPITRAVMETILRRASAPAVETLLEHVGLYMHCDEGVATGRTDRVDAGVSSLWTLLTDEEKRFVENTRDDLEQLRHLEPRHPLVGPLLYGLAFKGDALDSYDRSLQRYEMQIEAALAEYRTGSAPSGIFQYDDPSKSSHYDSELSTLVDDGRQQDVLSSLARRLGRFAVSDPSPRTMMLRDALDASSEFLKPEPQPTDASGSVIHVHLPLLRLQARQVQTALLRALFTTCNLTAHLDVLHAHYLLADGIFLQRLSAVIFSDDAMIDGYDCVFDAQEKQFNFPCETGTRQALEDISPTPVPSTSLSKHNHEHCTPAVGLSFRDLSQSQVSALVQSGMLHTLELLSLKCSPSRPVARIIDADALAKYDQIFRHLLRLGRVRLIVERTNRRILGRLNRRVRRVDIDRGADAEAEADAVVRRFVVEAHFFASTLNAYAHGCVERTWIPFRQKLDQMRDRVLGPQPMCVSIDQVANLHRVAVAQICARLGMSPWSPSPGPDRVSDFDRITEQLINMCLSLSVRGCRIVSVLQEDGSAVGDCYRSRQIATLSKIQSDLNRSIRRIVQSSSSAPGLRVEEREGESVRKRDEGSGNDNTHGDEDGNGNVRDGEDGNGHVRGEEGGAGNEHGRVSGDSREDQSGQGCKSSPLVRLGEMLNYNGFYTDA